VAAFASLARIAEARVRRVGRRMGLRLTLIAACALAGSVFLFFALAALTVALTEEIGLLDALAVIAAGALVIVGLLLAALALEARSHRRTLARQRPLDRQLLQAAALSAVPSRLPSRPVAGLALVAFGALLVLMRREGSD
jgi:heme/copper-type cytochrome/quinol oxidase subunit 2